MQVAKFISENLRPWSFFVLSDVFALIAVDFFCISICCLL